MIRRSSSKAFRATVAAAGAALTVEPAANSVVTRSKREHWDDDQASGFHNPWASYPGSPGIWAMFKFLARATITSIVGDPDIANYGKLVPRVNATFGAGLPAGQLKASWLGHACFLLEFPTVSAGSSPGAEDEVKGEKRGVRVLTDPVFSDRCSPIPGMGPLRYGPPPAYAEDLPEVDIVAISHNHYDHCDLPTLKRLYDHQASHKPVLFTGLGGIDNLRSTVGNDAQLVEMDWWESRVVDVQGVGKVKVICTPAQHNCARTPFDKDKALWSSFAFEAVVEGDKKGASVWFGGDTGYSATDKETHELEPERPVCPAFKEIGDKIGPFTLGLIPIGAFAPRPVFSGVHNAPIDAVRMFKDLQCKTAIGIHWGTWRMALDRIAEAPERLVDARKLVGITEEQFGVVALGESKGFDP